MYYKVGQIVIVKSNINTQRKHGVKFGDKCKIVAIHGPNSHYTYTVKFLGYHHARLNEMGPFMKHSELTIKGKPEVIKLLYGEK